MRLRLLLDTHVFLWFLEDSRKLRAPARAAIADGVATRPIDLDDYTRSLVRWSQQGSANPPPLELQARSV